MPRHIHGDLEENTAVGGIDPQHFYQGFVYKGVGEVKISYGKKIKKKEVDKWKSNKEEKLGWTISE